MCAYAWHFLWHHEAAWTDLFYIYFTNMIRTHFCRCCCVVVVGIEWLQPVVDVTVNLDAGFPVRSFLVVLLLLAFYTSINIHCFMMRMFCGGASFFLPRVLKARGTWINVFSLPLP